MLSDLRRPLPFPFCVSLKCIGIIMFSPASFFLPASSAAVCAPTSYTLLLTSFSVCTLGCGLCRPMLSRFYLCVRCALRCASKRQNTRMRLFRRRSKGRRWARLRRRLAGERSMRWMVSKAAAVFLRTWKMRICVGRIRSPPASRDCPCTPYLSPVGCFDLWLYVPCGHAAAASPHEGFFSRVILFLPVLAFGVFSLAFFRTCVHFAGCALCCLVGCCDDQRL